MEKEKVKLWGCTEISKSFGAQEKKRRRKSLEKECLC